MRRAALCVLLALAVLFVPGIGTRTPSSDAGSTSTSANEGAFRGVVFLSAGGGHVLTIKRDGTVWAWGYDAHGELGNGKTQAPSPLPIRAGSLAGIRAVAAGEFQSLALKRDRTVLAWGKNDKGQLGNGTTKDQLLPVRVAGVSNVKAIDADVGRSYALRADGRVFAWGANDKGQLGNGTKTDSTRPVQVSGLSGIVAIASGYNHALALTKAGVVWAWGDNTYGQLGDGTSGTTPQRVPVRVRGLRGRVKAIAAGQNGDDSLALLDDGTVWAWGRNDYGDLGNGTVVPSSRPVQVNGIGRVKAIGASGGTGIAVTSDGSVWDWGDNKLGQLGNGSHVDHNATPVRVNGLTGITEVAGGGGFAVAVKSDGTVHTWGSNKVGELGIGEAAGSSSYVPVLVRTTAAAAGGSSGFLSTTTLLLILLAVTLPLAALISRSRMRVPIRRPLRSPVPPQAAPVDVSSWTPAQTGRAGGFGVQPAFPPDDLDGAWREYGRRVRFLSRVSLLTGASHEVLAHVATALKPVTVPARGIVCREGDVGDRFFLVEAGTLAITADIGGKPREVALLGPGDFFGEMALLDGGRRSATVAATTDAELWTLSAADFRELVTREPEIETIVRSAAGQRGTANRMRTFDVEQRNLAALTNGQQRLRIGRSPDNEIVFASRMVSGHHAVVEWTNGTVRLRDLESANGTYVNGVQVNTVDLSDGDEIWVGDERFFFDRRAIHHPIEPRGIRLDATNLGKEIRGGKKLLQDVTLSVLPGEFVAIVGGSGTGKTTLMDALSGVRPATAGAVLYNGRDYYANLDLFRNVLGYVPQDDIIHTGLPLRLTLRHAARLRLPPDTLAEDLDAAVDGAIAELELTAQADTKVALLSGGQRKRSSIGAELVTEPRIFFLDEPTSGLDPFTETQMMKLLRHLANDGSTVILTTHATKNVMLCDKVVFLGRGGHLAFVGPPERALEYFQADAFDTIYERLTEESTPEGWAGRFLASPESEQVVADQLRLAKADASGAERQSLGGTGAVGGFRRQLRQFAVLTRRSFDLLVHNPGNAPSLVAPPILFTALSLALFHSGAFKPTANSAVALQILFLLSFSAFIFGLLFGIQEIVKEFPIFRRERLVNLGVLPYVLSKLAILAPLLTVLLILMVLVLRFTGRLPANGLDVYWRLVVTLILTGLVGLVLGLFTSASVSTSQQATDMLSVWIMPQVLFGGALLAVPAMNAIGRVISAVAPVRWSFEGLGHIVNLTGHFGTDTSRIGPGLAFEYGDTFRRALPQNLIILCLFVIVPLALSCSVLNKRTASR